MAWWQRIFAQRGEDDHGDADDLPGLLRVVLLELRTLHRLLDLAPVGLWVVRADGSIPVSNRAARLHMGGAPDYPLEVSEQQARLVDVWTGEPIDMRDWPAVRALAGERHALTARLHMFDADGRITHQQRQHIMAAPMVWQGRVVAALICTIREDEDGRCLMV